MLRAPSVVPMSVRASGRERALASVPARGPVWALPEAPVSVLMSGQPSVRGGHPALPACANSDDVGRVWPSLVRIR